MVMADITRESCIVLPKLLSGCTASGAKKTQVRIAARTTLTLAPAHRAAREAAAGRRRRAAGARRTYPGDVTLPVLRPVPGGTFRMG